MFRRILFWLLLKIACYTLYVLLPNLLYNYSKWGNILTKNVASVILVIIMAWGRSKGPGDSRRKFLKNRGGYFQNTAKK